MAVQQPLPQFDELRKQAKQRANQASQAGTEAMKRRFAAIGGLGSGASIKQENLVRQQANQQAEDAMTGINAAEAQERSRIADRDFAAQQNQLQRDFAGKEAEKGRSFQREISDKDFAFKNQVFAFEKDSKLKQLDLAQKQFDLDNETTEFNKRIAAIEAGINYVPASDGKPSETFKIDPMDPASIKKMLTLKKEGRL